MPKPKSKPDPARVAEVLAIRLDGAELHDVLSFGREKWGADFTPAEAKALLDAADLEIFAQRDKSRGRARAVHIQRLKTLYARCVASADLSTAARVADSIARLQGLQQQAKDRRDLLRLVAAQQQKIAALTNQLSARQLQPAKVDDED